MLKHASAFVFADRIAVVERQVDETLTEMVDEEKKNFDELLKVGLSYV